MEKYNPENWRLFIDSSKRSLKCVLLHNGNKYGSIPIAHSVSLRERYEEIKMVLEKIKYTEHRWLICVDLKMVSILLGQQTGYTKFPCFLCMWDSRDHKNHYSKNRWPARVALEPCRQKNVLHQPLVSREKIVLPPLHIKLGLIKQFIKAIDKEGECFKYICRKFSSVTMEKLKAGILDGPQIRELMRDDTLQDVMTLDERNAWHAFCEVVRIFLGNYKSSQYKSIVRNLLKTYKVIGANMSIKLHYLASHLDHFPANLGDFSDEQGERFHQDLKDFEVRYQGRWDTTMMADYCWCLKRDQPAVVHPRAAKKRTFLS